MAAVTEKDKLAKAIAKKLHSLEGTARAWDLKLEDSGADWACASMVVREDMLNGLGTTHGGMIFALADTVFAWACNSANVRTFAQHASITFLSAGKLGEKLTAQARLDAAEARTGVYTVHVKGDDGRIIAVFQGLSRTAGGEILENKEAEND